ncbi:MAG: SusE domain-containing protein, partial [Alistipes sp.]|nr:SusE domain-containing protein [Alistipes sp.]
MKRIINSLFIFVLGALVLQGCKDDVDYGSTAGAVSELIMPSDNVTIDLLKIPSARLMFQWKSPDSKHAYTYKIAFYDSQTASTPFYTTLTDEEGALHTFTITHYAINDIVAKGGIDP